MPTHLDIGRGVGATELNFRGICRISKKSISGLDDLATSILMTPILFLANSLLLAYLSSQSIREAPMSLLDTPATVVDQEEATTEAVPLEESDEDHDGPGHDVPDLPVE